MIFKPLPSDDPLQRKPVISLAKNKLNWEPKFFLNQGLKEVNIWINKNHKELSEMSWKYLHKD